MEAIPGMLDDRGCELDVVNGCKCERLCREHATWLEVESDINIHQTSVALTMKCRLKQCTGLSKFNRKVRTGIWTLNKYEPHSA